MSSTVRTPQNIVSWLIAVGIDRRATLNWFPYLRWIVANENGNVCVVLVDFPIVAIIPESPHMKVKPYSSKGSRIRMITVRRDFLIRDFLVSVSLNKKHFCEPRERAESCTPFSGARGSVSKERMATLIHLRESQ
jgi:hypothetical protein